MYFPHFSKSSLSLVLAGLCFAGMSPDALAKDKDKKKDKDKVESKVKKVEKEIRKVVPQGDYRAYSSRDGRGDSDRRDYDRRDYDSRDYDRDRHRSDYYSRPRTTFSLNFGTGYAGRGYYYGPPGAAYYYERPEVRYYRTRELAPREYWDTGYRGGYSVGASVQSALSRRGYYRGPIDGSLGPYSRRAIAAWQADHGMRPTGEISPSLLRSLGI